MRKQLIDKIVLYYTIYKIELNLLYNFKNMFPYNILI